MQGASHVTCSIEKEVLSCKSPLYGRRTAQFIIEPFDFFDSLKFFPEYNLEDKVRSYGVLGGYNGVIYTAFAGEKRYHLLKEYLLYLVQ